MVRWKVFRFHKKNSVPLPRQYGPKKDYRAVPSCPLRLHDQNGLMASVLQKESLTRLQSIRIWVNTIQKITTQKIYLSICDVYYIGNPFWEKPLNWRCWVGCRPVAATIPKTNRSPRKTSFTRKPPWLSRVARDVGWFRWRIWAPCCSVSTSTLCSEVMIFLGGFDPRTDI